MTLPRITDLDALRVGDAIWCAKRLRSGIITYVQKGRSVAYLSGEGTGSLEPVIFKAPVPASPRFLVTWAPLSRPSGGIVTSAPLSGPSEETAPVAAVALSDKQLTERQMFTTLEDPFVYEDHVRAAMPWLLRPCPVCPAAPGAPCMTPLQASAGEGHTWGETGWCHAAVSPRILPETVEVSIDRHTARDPGRFGPLRDVVLDLLANGVDLTVILREVIALAAHAGGLPIEEGTALLAVHMMWLANGKAATAAGVGRALGVSWQAASGILARLTGAGHLVHRGGWQAARALPSCLMDIIIPEPTYDALLWPGALTEIQAHFAARGLHPNGRGMHATIPGRRLTCGGCEQRKNKYCRASWENGHSQHSRVQSWWPACELYKSATAAASALAASRKRGATPDRTPTTNNDFARTAETTASALEDTPPTFLRASWGETTPAPPEGEE